MRGWLEVRADRHVVELFRDARVKTALTGYIRQFEPLVVRALKIYTTTVSLSLQKAVRRVGFVEAGFRCCRCSPSWCRIA